MKRRIITVLFVALFLMCGGVIATDQAPIEQVNTASGAISTAPQKALKVNVPESRKLQQQPQKLDLTGTQLQQLVTEIGETSQRSYNEKAQGGEDIATAVAIDPPPSTMSGTTNGYADDYEGDCITTSGNSEDVVYSYSPPINEYVSLSLCNSSYWTNLWVYQDDTTNEWACNRFSSKCAMPRSGLDSIPMFTGHTYYIIIDGDAGQSGAYQLDVTTWPLPDFPDSTARHPAFGDNGNGLLLLGYEDNIWGDSTLPWFGSNDDGGSFPSGGSFAFGNNPSFPSCDFWGDDTVFYGTLTPHGTTLGGAPTYLTRIPNPMSTASWGQSYWDWSSFGWHDMRVADIACNNSVEFVQQPGVYRFGLLSMVHSTTYTDPDILDGPFIFYELDTNVVGRATIGWFTGLSGCQSTMNTIDPVTRYHYAVYDQFDGALWNLVIRRDPFADLKFDTQNISGGWTYTMAADETVQFPSVASYDGRVLIVTEYSSGSDTTDHDLIVWTDTTGQGNLDSLATYVVVSTTDDERYPRIEHVAGGYFVVTYVANNQLYMTTTSDYGLTWGTPTVMSGTDVVVNEYRSHDIADKGTKIIWEYYSNLPTDSTIKLHFMATSIVADSDGDTWTDDVDNCPAIANPGQEDADSDLLGDVCDDCTDTDDDGFGNPGYAANTCTDDNCPDVANPGQEDITGDGIGDACCCIGIRGNIDGDGLDELNVADLTFLVGFQFKGGPQPPCPKEIDLNTDGDNNIADLTYLVNYMFKSGSDPDPCL